MANIERVKHVAQMVAAEVNQGHQVVVAVSAMAGVTNQLIDWVGDTVGPNTDATEYDVVVSTGEQVTCGLLSLALKSMGVTARSWLGWQLPIVTDSVHKRAHIESIGCEAIRESLEQGKVAVVSGFQGVSSENRLTTLGRGGSDTTAVALAQVLNAERCDIYTDVEGVFTADPRIVPEARKLEKISYQEMLEFSWQGAKVLQPRSVDWAMRRSVPLRVLSSFTGAPGTWVVNVKEILSPPPVTGIATNSNVTMFTLFNLPESSQVWAEVLQPLEQAHIHVDMILQNPSDTPGRTNFTFTIGTDDRDLALRLLNEQQNRIGFQRITTETQVAQVAVVGMGMQERTVISSKMLQSLSEVGIQPQVVATSEMKVGVLLPKGQAIEATRVLHQAFDLETSGFTAQNKVA